ncbi:hypothetical protein ACNKHU_16245 [Shigella flexneri]
MRVNADGTLVTTGHPEALGSGLTYKWITTDLRSIAGNSLHQWTW